VAYIFNYFSDYEI
jgi:hypothetical protein